MLKILGTSGNNRQQQQKWFAEYKDAAQQFVSSSHSYSHRAALVLAAYDSHRAAAFAKPAANSSRQQQVLMHPMLEPF